MKVDTKKIKWLFNNYSAYEIAKLSGVPQPNITNIINGKRKIENLRISTGFKLTQLAEKLINKKLEN